MGKNKDKKKSGAGAAKTAAKTAKKESRNLLKSTGEDDIENILAELNAASAAVTEPQLILLEPDNPPAARSNGSLIPMPGARSELFLFGGEFYDGRTTRVLNDTILCAPWKSEFKKLLTPVQPQHRSAHQTVALERNGGEIYLFGGEFQSPSGSQFHHFKDFWVFSVPTLLWTQIKSKNSPSARSGHRMIAYKNQILVFGGFTDNGRDLEYHGDLRVFDVADQSWKKIETESGAAAPEARSGFCWNVDETNGVAYLYGGAGQRVKAVKGAAAGKGKPVKQYKPQYESVTFTDMWTLNLATMQWKEIKKKGICPSQRTGLSSTVFQSKGRAIYFGGVHDEAKSNESAINNKPQQQQSESNADDDDDSITRNFNDLYLFQFEHETFHYYPMKGQIESKKEIFGGKKIKNKNDEKSNSNAADEGETSGNSIFDFNPMTEALNQEKSAAAAVSPSESATKSADSADDKSIPVPLPRRSAHLVLRENRLIMFGGVHESLEDKEFTLGDWWELEIGKGETQWKEIIKFEINQNEWKGSDDEKDDEEEEEEEGEEDESDDEEKADADAADDKSGDPLKVRSREKLPEYFNRTKDHWMSLAKSMPTTNADEASSVGDATSVAVVVDDKELRRRAFQMATDSFKKQTEDNE